MEAGLLLLVVVAVVLVRADGAGAAEDDAASTPTAATLEQVDEALLLDDRGLGRYRRAAHLAVDAARRRNAQRVTAYVCWGRETAFLHRLLSSAGMSAQILAGADNTRAARVKQALSEGFYAAAVVVDAACPHADRFLDLASRLRLFHMANTWIVFENGLLLGEPPPDAEEAVAADDGEVFADLRDIPVHRFGAQDREAAVDADEEPFLEIAPPSPPRARHGLLGEQTAALAEGARAALDHKVVFVDSHVLWVQASHQRVEAYEVFRSCLARPLQGYLVAVSEVGADDGGDGDGLRWRWALDGLQEALLRERRADLQGATLRGSTIIKYPDEYTHIEDNALRQNDLYPKMNWPVTQNLAYSLNFGMLVYKRDNYGWDDGQGVFDGMVGELQRYEHDMLATAVFIRADRLSYMDLSAETFDFRTAALFRQPSKSSVSNVYVLPFSPGVWRAAGAVSLLAMLLLVVQTQWWRAHPGRRRAAADPSDHLEVGDCITFIVGALSQQGFFCTPTMVSARITFITTFIANLFLFTSFSGSIVAIIQSQSNAIRSVRDLLDSDLRMAVQDIRFQHVWFREAEADRRDIAGEAFRRKIRRHDSPGFVTTQEGIRRMRRGMYAFQVETNEGYREILDTFLESDKCDLAEVELFPAAPMVFCTAEKSPYREAITRNIRWQRETGLLHRISSRWMSQRPGCAGQTSTFVPIGLQEFYPALIVLYNGMVLALFIFCVEHLSKAKWVAACLARRGCWSRRRGGSSTSATPIFPVTY